MADNILDCLNFLWLFFGVVIGGYYILKGEN